MCIRDRIGPHSSSFAFRFFFDRVFVQYLSRLKQSRIRAKMLKIEREPA